MATDPPSARKWLVPLGRILVIGSVAIFGLISLLSALPRGKIYDLEAFISSGKAAGAGLNPYDSRSYPHDLEPQFDWGYNPNLNPPIALLLFERIKDLNPYTTYLIWWGISFLLYVIAVGWLMKLYRPALLILIWTFALAGFWGTLSLGQVYIPLLLLVIGAWLLLRNGREILAGILIGLLVAWKVNYLVWPVLLLCAGRPRSAIAAFISFLGVSLIPLAVYKPQIYAQWFSLITQSGASSYPTNTSLISLAARLGIPWLGYILAAGILLGLAVWAWRRRPPALEVSAVALVATMVVSPIAWVHYSLFLLPVFFSVRWSTLVRVSAYLLTVPILLVNLMGSGPTWLLLTGGSVYIWAILALFIALMAPALSVRLAPRPAA